MQVEGLIMKTTIAHRVMKISPNFNEGVLRSIITAPLNELRQSRSEFRGCLAVSKAYENFWLLLIKQKMKIYCN